MKQPTQRDSFLTSLASLIAVGIYFASLAFLICGICISVAYKSPVGAISWSEFFSIFMIGIVMFCAYSLEGIQQALNGVKSLDDDIIEGHSTRPHTARRILILRGKYEAFSSARQFCSVLLILLLKSSLQALVPPGVVVMLPYSIDVAGAFRSELVLYICSASIVVWNLQLLPKRIARLDPVDFLSPFRVSVAEALAAIGKPLERPVAIVFRLLQWIPGVSRKEEVIYPLSTSALKKELGRRQGYVVRSTQIRIVIDHGVQVIETTEYESFFDKRRVGAGINKMSHQIQLDGYWGEYGSFFHCSEPDVKATIKSTLIRRKDILKEYYPSALYIENAEDVESEEGNSESHDEVIDGKSHAYTSLVVDATLSRPVLSSAQKTHSFSFTNLFRSSDNVVAETGDPQLRTLEIGLMSVTPKLKIVIATKNNFPPTGSELRLIESWSGGSHLIHSEFATILPTELLQGERYACGIELSAPGLGAKLVIQTTA